MIITQETIPQVLDAALLANQKGYKFFPLFTGEAGIGKSEITQAWAKSQGSDFQYIDIRIAYYEGPDMVGLIYIVNGRTHYAIPEFWPTEGRGVIVFEEVNRGPISTQNALMQILTDMRVGKLVLPKDFFCVGIVNPDNGYQTNMMDPALRNRFIEYPVSFNKAAFCKWARENNWSDRLMSFLESTWEFIPVHLVKEDGTYVSPRSLSKLNILEKIGITEGVVFEATVMSVFGKELGYVYLAYCNKEKPVLVNDFIENEGLALERLKHLSELSNGYRGDLISASVESIIAGFQKGLLKLDLLFKLENALRRDVFITMLASLPEKNIQGLNLFVKENKDWLISVKKKREGIYNVNQKLDTNLLIGDD